MTAMIEPLKIKIPTLNTLASRIGEDNLVNYYFQELIRIIF